MIDLERDEVVALLDTQSFFDLLKLPYPTHRDVVLAKLASEQLIGKSGKGWSISRLAAILFAKRFSDFPLEVSRKAPRVVIYEGTGKLITKIDKAGKRDFAVDFETLVEHIHVSHRVPGNRCHRGGRIAQG